VPKGSYLIVEALDRLTREDIQPALLLILNLLQAGVRIVQMKPVEMIYDTRSDTVAIIIMLVELSRGHSESAMKSERIGKAWKQKLSQAKEGNAILTNKLPGWVENHEGTLRLILDRAEVVRRIYRLARQGHGLQLIARALTQAGVKPWGRSGAW